MSGPCIVMVCNGRQFQLTAEDAHKLGRQLFDAAREVWREQDEKVAFEREQRRFLMPGCGPVAGDDCPF